jgi:hypothetical protein
VGEAKNKHYGARVIEGRIHDPNQSWFFDPDGLRAASHVLLRWHGEFRRDCSVYVDEPQKAAHNFFQVAAQGGPGASDIMDKILMATQVTELMSAIWEMQGNVGPLPPTFIDVDPALLF